jgi:NADPH:quinone reductase-like Zn-dependent oxidoreductase
LKAIVQDEYGSADVLRLDTVDKPAPREDEVLLEVHAAGFDPGVWHLMTGLPYLVRLGFGLRKPKTRVPGGDVAGVVVAVGSDVSRLQPGDEVFGVCTGAFAEFACGKEKTLARKPKGLSFEQAAALPTSAITALRGLRDAGELKADQKVLIVGAAGGVGSFAVQIAKALGAEVTGVCSTTKVDLVRSLGADHVIDYTSEDFTQGGARYDLILDLAGRRPVAHLRRTLVRKGILVILGGEGGGKWLGGTERQMGALLLSPFVGHKLRAPIAMPRLEDLRFLRDLVEADKLAPVIDRSYPLADVAQAIHAWEQGHARGKVVITV